MTDFIEVYENILSDSLCERIIEKHKQIQESCASSFNREALHYGAEYYGGSRTRKDIAIYFEVSAPDLNEEINARLQKPLEDYLDKHPGLDMIPLMSDCVKVQETKRGGGFHLWHNEIGPGRESRRVLNWAIYLNDTVEGEGTTEFIEQGIKVQPKQGTLVFFPADWTHTHRGNPVYNCTKYLATGWFHRVDV